MDENVNLHEIKSSRNFSKLRKITSLKLNANSHWNILWKMVFVIRACNFAIKEFLLNRVNYFLCICQGVKFSF